MNLRHAAFCCTKWAVLLIFAAIWAQQVLLYPEFIANLVHRDVPWPGIVLALVTLSGACGLVALAVGRGVWPGTVCLLVFLVLSTWVLRDPFALPGAWLEIQQSLVMAGGLMALALYMTPEEPRT